MNKPTRRSRPRTEEKPVSRLFRFTPEEMRLLDVEAARQGISSNAVVVQALVARGIFPGVNNLPKPEESNGNP